MAPSAEFLQFIERYPPLAAIGNTPTVRVDLDCDTGRSEVFAKCEQLNPGGSIKDRPVLRMLVEAILAGDLTPDKTILDATSGNAGIAYAMIGAVLGYRVALVMPGERERGAQEAAHRAWRGDHRHRPDAGLRRNPLRGQASLRGRTGPLLLVRPVLEHEQPPGALRHDRRGDTGAGPQHHALRCRRRYRRHHQRCRAQAQGA